MGFLKRKERFRITCIVATTDSVTKGDKTYKFTEEQLKKVAKSFLGKAFLHKHRGRPIGKIEESWFKEGKLYVKGVIYEPDNPEERIAVEKIERGEIRGFSPSFSYNVIEPPLKKVVFHGTLEIVEEKEGGTLIFRGLMPKEEIEKKIGSIENLKKFKFTHLWIHDGTPESKKKIEELKD